MAKGTETLQERADKTADALRRLQSVYFTTPMAQEAVLDAIGIIELQKKRLLDLEKVAREFIWATEAELATVDDVEMKKGSSKSDKKRHNDIALRMVDTCELVKRLGLGVDRAPRVAMRIADLEAMRDSEEAMLNLVPKVDDPQAEPTLSHLEGDP